MNSVSIHSLEKPGAGSRVQILDWLRFVAAVCVVFYHWCFRGELDHNVGVRFNELTGLTSYLHLAVRLFYMISGFVICYSAMGKTAAQFAWSRFVRIFPTYWLCVTISWILLTLFWKSGFHVSFRGYLINLTLLHQYFKVEHVDVVYWTLLTELHFYAMMFFVLMFGLERRILPLVATWVGLSSVDYFIKIPLARFEMVLEDAPFFAAGVICYLIYRDGAKLKHWLLLAVCYAIAVTRFIRYSLVDQHDLGVFLSPQLLAIYIGLIFVIMIAVSLKVFTGLNSSLSPVFGGISYPLYLLHDRIGFMLEGRLGGVLNRWVMLLVIFVGLFSFSYAVWRWFEVPVMASLHRKFGHYFRPKARPTQALV
jgi:peptidoglycan/LPS O-acetylase OafA/YrhL